MKTQTINPVEEISCILEKNGYGKGMSLGHIKYDPSINEDYDYQIIRGSTHDGTLLFQLQLIDKVLLPLVNKSTYCKKDIKESDLSNVKDVSYTIGDLKIETVFNDEKYPTNQEDTVYVPVKCEYVFR